MQMQKSLTKTRGAILIMAAMILVILIGIAAFALDLGRLYVLHTEMQNAVDAAVISAAAELDGELGARDRAKAAATQEMLNHYAHFSRKNELLEDLESGPNIISFYSWIGGSFDSSSQPSDCVETEPGKCDATGDDDAAYVRIRLDPELFGDGNGDGDGDGRYEIDLYFLPVLSLLGIDTPGTASTRVMALAGSHYEACNYPPIIICDPSENGDALNPGQMVKLKEHQTGDQWGPGTFGWLMPTEVAEDPDDDSLNENRLLAHRLGSIYGQKCSPPIVKVKPGAIANWPRWGLNTRFGIYENINESEYFPSAPNVIDYPRDDNLTSNPSGECDDSSSRFGSSIWDISECHSDTTLPAQQPSSYSKADFNTNFHKGKLVPAMATRNQYYSWELSIIGNLAINTVANLHADETQCNDKGKPNSCRMLQGTPFNTANFVDDADTHKRRELFVAAVACIANNVKANSVINLDEVGGKWMRFFLTEHVDHPGGGGINVYAEFIEEVTGKDDEHFKKVIQLYE